MNYLAHIYLSGDHELISIGNFMADHVKGKDYNTYPEGVQKGILLHRQIDSFTDAHDIVRMSKRRLNDRYGLYRGIIIDIFYDHFLAKNWHMYSDTALGDYTQAFYKSLRKHYELLPDKVKHISQYLVKEDWLLSYATTEGIQRVLEGMNRRTGYKSGMNLAITDLEDHFEGFENDFKQFFEELSVYSNDKIMEINKSYE